VQINEINSLVSILVEQIITLSVEALSLFRHKQDRIIAVVDRELRVVSGVIYFVQLTE